MKHEQQKKSAELKEKEKGRQIEKMKNRQKETANNNNISYQFMRVIII